jgi:hypothetical protein
VVQGVVATLFAGVSTFIANPADFIWDVILQGIRTRFMALLEALLKEETT